MKSKVFYGFLVLVASAMLAWSPSSAGAASLGKFCFQMDAFSDLWIWDVEQVGSDTFQVTGNDVQNGPCAMNGGGRILDGHILFSVKEDCPAPGFHGQHAIDLNLANLSGTTDLLWLNPDGSILVSFTDLTFHNITCPLSPVPGASQNGGQGSSSGR